MEVKPRPYQQRFLLSQARFPCMISAVGTGKTFMMLLKVWLRCEAFPGTVALVVRKEFTDLRDSTLVDFKRYFGEEADSRKEYTFPNGSLIMFRHGGEITASANDPNVLKNLNLDLVAIEQAEEFQTDEVFDFLRDRLRGTAYERALGKARGGDPCAQQLICIANANGHNWMWRRWINNPPSAAYDVTLANTFDNAENLSQAFLDDLRAMEAEAPEHYAQYVMNSFDVTNASDQLITTDLLQASLTLELGDAGLRRRIGAVDVARFGGDEIVFTILESRGVLRWEQIDQQAMRFKGLDETIGKSQALIRDFQLDAFVVDDDGVGGGVTDLLKGPDSVDIFAFRGGMPAGNERFENIRTEAGFRLQEYLTKGWLKVLDDPVLHDQCTTVTYRYKPSGGRILVSKDEMRKKGLKSPDRFDALIMALFYTDAVVRGDRRERLPAYGIMDHQPASRPTRLPAYAGMA